MRRKPDELGLCHKDGCGADAKWIAETVLPCENFVVKGLSTIKVCDVHRTDAADYLLNDDNRRSYWKLLVDNNYVVDYWTGYIHVKENMSVHFQPIQKDIEEAA